MAPIISFLASEGLSLLAKVIQKKGKEYIEKKFNIKIPNNIENIDKETLLKLKELEQKHELELYRILFEEEKLHYNDLDSARNMYTETNISKETPYLNKIYPTILASFTVIFTFILFAMLIFGKISETQKDIILYILGASTSYLSQIFSFYFGSSIGSKDKTDVLSKLVREKKN